MDFTKTKTYLIQFKKIINYKSKATFMAKISFIDAPLLTGEIVKCGHRAAHLSKRLSPLSAIILLYFGNISKKPGFRIIS